MNIYEVGAANAVGNLLGTVQRSVYVPYRPSADPVLCPSTNAAPGDFYDAASGQCHGGLYFVTSFDFSSLNLTLPDRVIVSAAFNTSTSGYAPVGPVAPGDEDGFDALNMALDGVNPPNTGTFVNAMYIAWTPALSLSGPSAWGAYYLPKIALYGVEPATTPVAPRPPVRVETAALGGE